MQQTFAVAPQLADIRAAQALLSPFCLCTPLVRLDEEAYSPGRQDGTAREIFLKLENLQPVGAFKVRCMGHAVLSLREDQLRQGIYTASSGNAGLGLAWIAGRLGIDARVYAPASAPAAKLDAVRRLGAAVTSLPDGEWWEIITKRGHARDPGRYVDAVRSPAALAGNGTIGLEIIEQLPDVDTIVLPFGGGGLACGVAAAIRALKRDTRIIVAECETAAPVAAALRAGRPVSIEVTPSFISGAGARSVLEEMWPLVREHVAAAVVSPLAAVTAAVRRLFEQNRVVAEGAGAIALAAALSGECGGGKIACVVSGGNIAPADMAAILQGQPV